jgi:hypothetical protein
MQAIFQKKRPRQSVFCKKLLVVNRIISIFATNPTTKIQQPTTIGVVANSQPPKILENLTSQT